jgi:putative nucleotidyltransferase with HDIG domain
VRAADTFLVWILAGARGPGSLLSYPRRHIRWKIIAPYVVLAIVLAGVGTFLVTRLVTGSLQERFDNQLAEAARVTSDSFVRRERKHLEVVREVAFTDGVASVVEQGYVYRLSAMIDPIAANSQAERVEVLDASGVRVFGAQLTDAQHLTYAPISEPDDRASWPIVQGVLGQQQDALGDKFAGLVQTPAGAVLYTAGPIYDGNTLAGVVLVGSSLQNFLPSAKTEALADITVYDFSGAPLATTFVDEGNNGEADFTPSQAAVHESGAQAVREHKVLYGRNFDLLYGRLVIRDQVVGLYSVGLPSSFIFTAGTATRWQMGLLFAFGTLTVLLIGWLIARSLTRPLLRLVAVAQAVAAGDLTARSNIRSQDEVGVLGGSFDQMTAQLQEQHLSTIRALTSAIDARDPYTLGHSVRVGQLAVMIGTALRLPESQLQHLEIGGYLHDIGKIGVRDAVLLKPAALTAEERRMIEQHPRIGLDILAPVKLAPEVIAFVAGHHEKLDGTGYPAGIGGGELSIIARIASVADIYDALTTDRPYRRAMTPGDALEIIRREVAEGHLDGGVVETFGGLVEQWETRRRTDERLRGYRIPGWPEAEAA